MPSDPNLIQSQTSSPAAAKPKVENMALDEIPFFLLEEQKSQGWNAKKLQLIFKLYLLPVITLSIFIFILLQFVLPELGRIWQNLDTTSQTLEQVTVLDTTVANLVKLVSKDAELQEQLDALNSVVPTGLTSVSGYNNKVISLAAKHTLVISQADTDEDLIDVEEDQISAVAMVQIPAKFAVQGSLLNIRNFISELQSVDDFVIIGEMDLRRATDEQGEVWLLRISLWKYQFQQADSEGNDLEQIYERIPPTALPDPTVLEIVNENAT